MALDALLHFGFLQRALISGVFIGVACAVLGVFLVLRRDAMIGDGLSHVAFAGVALGLVLNVLPLAAALAVSVAGAFGIMKLKASAGLHGDTAIGIFSSLGMAVGILLATMAGDFNVDLLSYLFGEVLAIEPFEVWLSMALAGLIIAAVAANYSQLMFMTFDRETARVSGVAVGRLDGLLTVLTAVTVVLGMKVVGILLVAALMVIPAAAGLQAAGSFRKAVVVASAVSVASVVLGLALALSLDVPASAAIVIVAFLAFGGFALLKGRKKGLI
jgi:zinc transport system permease protein